MTKITLEDEFVIYERTVWAHFANIFLGVWLLLFPTVYVSGSYAIDMNDHICGALIILLSMRSISPKNWLAPWMVALVGVWLQFAPLIFHAPLAASLNNESFIGVFIIIFSVMVPRYAKAVLDPGPEVPPGWSYNPSSWTQRIPIIALGMIGWFCARYLVAYQVGHIPEIIDPAFGDGTKTVITSEVSKAFPVSDAGLGATAYLFESLLGLQGGTKRWHQMPWSVFFFGFIVIPVGLTTITLVILQPIVVGAWCFWCLFIALCMLLMISLTVDEVALVFQYLRHVRRTGGNVWRVFWCGGEVKGGSIDTQTPLVCKKFTHTFASMFWGVNLPWNICLCIVVGCVMMALPQLLGITAGSAKNIYILGPFTVVVACIALAEVTRIVRYLFIPMGAWLILSTFVLQGGSLIANMLCGFALIALSLRKGEIYQKFSFQG